MAAHTTTGTLRFARDFYENGYPQYCVEDLDLGLGEMMSLNRRSSPACVGASLVAGLMFTSRKTAAHLAALITQFVDKSDFGCVVAFEGYVPHIGKKVLRRGGRSIGFCGKPREPLRICPIRHRLKCREALPPRSLSLGGTVGDYQINVIRDPCCVGAGRVLVRREYHFSHLVN